MHISEQPSTQPPAFSASRTRINEKVNTSPNDKKKRLMGPQRERESTY